MKMSAIHSIHQSILESDMDIDQAFEQYTTYWGSFFSFGELMQVWETALEMIPELN